MTSEVAEAILQQVPTGEYPNLTKLTVNYVLKRGSDYGREFDFGLNLILYGLEIPSAGND